MTTTAHSTPTSGPQTDETPLPGMTRPTRPENPADSFTCSGCDTRWRGVSRAHCAACHHTFAGETMFDRHRRDLRGTGICLDPETIRTSTGEPAMFLTNGLWQSIANPAPRTAPRKNPA